MPQPNLLAALVAVSVVGATQVAADSLVDYEEPLAEAPVVQAEVAPKTAAEAMEAIAANDPAVEVTSDADGHTDGMVMLSDVLFGYKEAGLAPEAIGSLEAIAAQLHGIDTLEVVGHTDSVGSEAYNVKLGQARADAVLAWLIDQGGFSSDAVKAISAGESSPIAANHTETGADDPEGRARNRRVEFRIIKTDPIDVADKDVDVVAANFVE